MNSKSSRFFLLPWNCLLAFLLAVSPIQRVAALPDLPTSYLNGSNPIIHVQISGMYVYGIDWPGDSPVTLTVDDDADTGNGVLFLQTKPVVPCDDNPALGCVTFSFGKNTNTIELEPGQYVTLSNGTISKDTWIADVRITSVKDDPAVIQGQGPANRPAHVYVGTADGGYDMDITVDNDSHWVADFGGGSSSFQNISGVNAWVFDEDGDSTEVYYQIPNIYVDPNSDEFGLYFWPLYGTATVEIDDPSDGIGDVDFSTTVYIEHIDDGLNFSIKNETEEILDLSGVFDIKPGFIITVTETATPTKVHTVAGFTGFDIEADTVTGLAEADALVDIQTCNGLNCSTRHVLADGGGAWVADFSQAGDELDEQDTFNIVVGTLATLEQQDIDRDLSWYEQYILMPGISGFYANGGFLYDSNGVNFVMRGVNHPHTWFRNQTSSFAHIKAKGANTVRVVLSSGKLWPKNGAADVANVIALCKNNKLICVLEVHDTTGYVETPAVSLAEAVEYWISIKSVLEGQEAYVIINLGNEPYGNVDTSNWVDDTKDAIAAMRTAGFQHMLMVDAPNWGQDWEHHMQDHAAEILASDANGNTVFSIHMYGVYETAESIENYISTFVNAGLPIVVGEFGHFHSDGDPDEDAIMASAQSHGIGYLGWSWSGNSGVGYLDMVTDFNPNKLTKWGKRIFYGENGICLTSVEASVYGGDRDPMVCSVKTAGPNPSNASSVNFTVTFSEAVTDVDADDFVLATTNVIGSAITSTSGSGSVYTVTVNTGSGNGTIRLDLIDNDSIEDVTNNALSGAGTGNGNFKLGELYTIKRSKPVLLLPATGALVNTLQPNLDWKDSNPAYEHYQVQVSTNNAFTSPVIDDTTLSFSTFTPASGLTPGKLYYWRVKGFSSIGDTNPWSAKWTFKTPLSQPVVVSPTEAESLTTDRPTFEWNAVDGATSYVLQVSTASNFSTLLVNVAVTQSQYTAAKDLPQNKTLFWRVRAKSPAVTGPWSVKWTFKTGNPPTVPVLAAPLNAALIKDYTPPFNWNNATSPAGTTFKYYEIQWDEDKYFASPVTHTTTLNDRTDSDFTPLIDLASNTKFYWRVRAVNTEISTNENHTSGWSPIWSFRTIIPAPQSLTMTPNPGPLQPSFSWDAAAGMISGYTIQVSTTSNFSTLLVHSTNPNPWYVMVKNLPAHKTIYWRVRVNGANGPSAWSKSQFITP